VICYDEEIGALPFVMITFTNCYIGTYTYAADATKFNITD